MPITPSQGRADLSRLLSCFLGDRILVTTAPRGVTPPRTPFPVRRVSH